MYASEMDGDYYKCACGKTTEHSYLLSSSDGFITDCCREAGWVEFEYKGVWHKKKPEETFNEVKRRADAYEQWHKETDWPRYYRDNNYRESRSRDFHKNV